MDAKPTERLDASTRAALDHHFEAFRAQSEIPALAYGVVSRQGLIHHGASGLSSIEHQQRAGSRSVFRIASMTKSFTALLVLYLRDQGLVHLDEPAARYVPELEGLAYPTSDTAPITLAHLVTMSAGLVEDDPWADRQLDMSPERFSDLLKDGIIFNTPPGTGYEYSNLGFALLGRAIETLSDTSLPDLARSVLFGPLEMGSTTFDVNEVPSKWFATGYRKEKGEFCQEPPLAHGAFGAMGGLMTCVEDFASYVAMHLGAWPPSSEPERGPIARSTLREMTAGGRTRPTGPLEQQMGFVHQSYGFGLVTAEHERDGLVVGHSGGLPGYGSHVEWLPHRGLGVFAFANRTYARARPAVRAAFDLLFHAGVLEDEQEAPSLALSAAQRALEEAYNAGEASGGSFLATYFLDKDDERKAPDLASLRHNFGPCAVLGPITTNGALRGSWTMQCERGNLKVSVMLGPFRDGAIQFATIEVE